MKIKNSIIVPAYNEEKRAGAFIPELLLYIKENIPDTEVIIVNDGSKDNTEKAIQSIIKDTGTESFTSISSYIENQGKGYAISYGVRLTKGDKIIFIDADGSIAPKEIIPMISALDNYDFVSGSRLLKESKVDKTLSRSITSFGFNSLVSMIFQLGYQDNLCGFKGFKSAVVRELFKDLKDTRWIFDVELFYKAKKRKYSLKFIPIEWKEVGGSHVRLFIDPIKWFFQMIRLRMKLINY